MICPHGKQVKLFEEWQCEECDKIISHGKETPTSMRSGLTAGSMADEFELLDRLATILGIAGNESQEVRHQDVVYKRRVLRAAIRELERAFKK